ncbi:MAG: putative secreted protein, SAP09, SAP39-like [Candidatus Phytoplasma citri]|nr:MAG: putative secreted protein, SAP09, SAP39-like [Candidatus Phytoplasma aurantifolia]
MHFQTKNKILTIFTIIICAFLTIEGIRALRNYFIYQSKETIKLMNENDIPIFEVKRIDGNNEDKILIPLSFPNLNPDKYQHLITINHQATLTKNGFDINVPLFLKITTNYDTENTFSHPETYFNLEIKNNGVKYDDTKRLPMVLNSEDGHLDIQIKLEQKQFINQTNPCLNLIIDYELVDQDGNAWSGGSQTIENKIIQTA